MCVCERERERGEMLVGEERELPVYMWTTYNYTVTQCHVHSCMYVQYKKQGWVLNRV